MKNKQNESVMTKPLDFFRRNTGLVKKMYKLSLELQDLT